MNLFSFDMMTFIETSGILAPLLFVIFHLIRPLFFLPVILICISGGMFFGTFAGTIYSVIGITLSSIIFYVIIHKMPKTFNKCITVKERIFGKYSVLTTPQITILRLIPLIHFQILSFCMLETSPDFKNYTKSSLLSSVPVATLYTSLGQSLSELSLLQTSTVFIVLFFIVYLLRRKEISIKWDEFFTNEKSEINEYF